MSDKSRARAVQRVSNWPYQKCLEWVKKYKDIIRKHTTAGTQSEAAVDLWRDIEGVKLKRDSALSN